MCDSETGKAQELTHFSQTIGLPVRIAFDTELKAFRIGDATHLAVGLETRLIIFDTGSKKGSGTTPRSLLPYYDEDFDEDPDSVVGGDTQLPDQTSNHSALSYPEGEPEFGASPGRVDKSSKSKNAKLPKPPNSFILYRKFKQPMVLASHPDLHCSKVCKFSIAPFCVPSSNFGSENYRRHVASRGSCRQGRISASS